MLACAMRHPRHTNACTYFAPLFRRILEPPNRTSPSFQQNIFQILKKIFSSCLIHKNNNLPLSATTTTTTAVAATKETRSEIIMSSKAIVVGASGYIGKATLGALVSRHADKVKAFAGARNPDKFGTMDGVEVVKADMGDKVALSEALKGFDAAFLVVPGHESRTELALNGIEAAKEAGVKFLLVLSVLTVETDSIFGKQFDPVEEKTKESGIDYAIVRLPLFIDNNYASAGSIKEQGTFYDPRDPAKMHTPVAVADAGKAAADILADPSKHVGKTYKLVSPPFSLNDLAAAFSKTLEKEVKVTTVPYDAAKSAFMGMGFPEWQVDGIMELYKFIDSDSPKTNESELGDIELITGEKPLTVEAWVEQNAAGFK